VNRRGLRLAVISAAVVVAVLAVGLAVLPEVVRRVVVWGVGASTGRAVTLDAVELRLFGGRLAFRGLRIADHDGATLAALDRVDARFSPRDLLRLHVRLTDVTVDAPSVRIVRTGPREFNVSDLIRAKKSEARPTRLRLTIERFQLRGGAVVVEDRTVTPARTTRIDATARLRDASTLADRSPGSATLEATIDGAPLTVIVDDLRLAPAHLRAVVKAERLPVALASLALPPDSPLGRPGGSLTLDATVAHDATTGTLVTADATLAGVELRRAGDARAFAAAPAIRVTVDGLRARPGAVEVRRVAVDGGGVTLEDARLGRVQRWRVDGVAFEAKDLSSARDAAPGTATARATMAGAQVSAWAGNVRLAPLELHATTIVRNVDLSVLRVYLPPTLPVQPERGVIDATVRVDHDARGTRLALDARLTNFELRRPAHFVAAPAMRVVVENVLLDRGAVTVGHAAITGARLTLEERTVTPARTWLVQNLVVDAKDLSSRRDATQGVGSVQATVAGASVAAFVTQARLEPLELHATANVRNLDLALVRLYLPPDAPLEPARGVINAAAQIDHTVAGGTRVVADATLTGLQARGRGALATVTVTSPSVRVTLTDGRRHQEKLSVARVELSGSGSVVDSRGAASRKEFTQLRAATEGLTWPVSAPARVEVSARFGDRGELDASGTATLTAPLPRIEWAADLSLAFRRVDLAPLGVYVPAARGLGGRVQATVTAKLAYVGALTARVRGDVASGRFALVEGDRTLVSLRRIDVKGLDAQWPDRIAIEQVRLRQPYALLERDRQGRLVLVDRFTPPAAAAAAPAPATGERKPRVLPVAVGELIVEDGSALVVDASGGAPARLELPRVNLTARDVTWPATGPARVALDAALSGGGSVKVEGAVVGEPASVDVKVTLANADIAAIQPWLPFRALVRGRLDTALTVAGPIAPSPRVAVRGDAALRGFAVADGARPVITVEAIEVGGIDAAWPERVALDRVRVRRSWALLERDRSGDFPLQGLFLRPSRSAAPPASAPAAPPLPGAAPSAPPPSVALTVREFVLEDQGATIVDAVVTPPARLEVAGARLRIQDLVWPAGSMKAELAAPMPGGGRLNAAGSIALTPLTIDARVGLDAVSIEPAQPYLPIEGKVVGQVTGDVTVKVGLAPVSIRVTGQTQLQRFRLNDGERPVVTVGRVDVAGIDVDWPRRIALERVLLRRPRLLVERDALGQIRLWKVAVPDWSKTPAVDGAAAAPAPRTAAAPASAAPPAPVVEVASFRLERASARFVDQSTTPTYAEELSNVELTVTPLTTMPEARTRFTASGGIGGGAFKIRGEAAAGEPMHVDLTVDVKDFVVPRANPYLDLYTGWTATRGSLSITGTYGLDGTRLTTRHDVVARDLDLEPVDTRDEVERRVGLPFGLLVSLLKDSRGVIKLSVPVAGDISTREFDYQDALWGAVRTLALRIVALPFSRIGSLFVSEDSKVEAVAITPVTFEPGTDRLTDGMEAHLQKIAGFLRDTPAVNLALQAVFTQADADALKAQADPTEAMRVLGEQRLTAVREAFARAGIKASRLQGRVPRRPLIEAAGASRVELNPRPGGA
jgi:hypothetical protein